METKTFTYGGYTFEPRGQFKDYGIKPGKNEMRNICCKLNSCGFGLVADRPYLWSEFLADIHKDRDEYEHQNTVGIKSVRYSCNESGKIVFVEFVTGNKYSVTCGKPFAGYRYFCEAVRNAETLRGDEQKFYNEIATGRYDNYLNS